MASDAKQKYRISLTPSDTSESTVMATVAEDAATSQPGTHPVQPPASATARPPRPYLAPSKTAKHTSLVRVATMSSFWSDSNSIAESAISPPLEHGKPPYTLRSALSNISLTPSDVQYPAGLLLPRDTGDVLKAERVLGLRRQPKTAEAQKTPQSVLNSNAKDSSSSLTALPKYEQGDWNPSLAEDPLNGRTAWLHSLTGALIVFNCWGMANVFGLFQAYYEGFYLPAGTSPSSVSWIGSTQLALVFGLGVPVGRLVDKGYFRIVFHGGSIVMLIGIFCTAWCKALWSLWLVQGLITGLGMGMVFCSAVVALMTWFDERKIGAAMGVGAAGSCFGGIVFILVARHFLFSHGFPTTMRILGAISAVALIPPNLVFRVRGQSHPSRRRDMAKVKLSLSMFTAPSYVLAAGGMFFAFLGVYFGFVYMVSFAYTQLNLSDTASTNLLIFMLVANLPGRFIPALISDKCIGPLNTIIPSLFLSAGCVAMWMALGDGRNTRGALTVIACFYGFVSAGVQVLYAATVYGFCLEPAAMTNAASTQSERESIQLAKDRMGTKAGGIFSCIGVACLIGTPIGGALIKYRTDRAMVRPYLGAQIFAMVCLLMGGCLLLASRVARVGWQARRA